MEGVYPFVDRLDTAGPFALSLDILRAAFFVMADRVPAACETDRQIKVGLLGGWFQSGGEEAATDAARTAFQALGGQDTVELTKAELGRSAAFVLTAAEGGHRHLENLRSAPMAFDPATRDRLIAGALIPDTAVQTAEVAAQASIDELLEAVERYDVLIAPSTPCTAPEIAAGTIEIDGKKVSARANLGLYTQALSLAGVPVLSVPMKRDGLPIGVQLVAARGREDVLFQAAQQLVDQGIVEARVASRFADGAP